jgi:hypothetical protein
MPMRDFSLTAIAFGFLVAASAGCDKSDQSPRPEPAPRADPRQALASPEPAAEAGELVFFGYRLGMPRTEALRRAADVHGFELKPPHDGDGLISGADGRGTIAGLDASAKLGFADDALSELMIVHETTEKVALVDSALFKTLVGDLGRAMGCAGDPEATSCWWKSGKARVEISTMSHWPKGASAEHHEYKVRAHVERPPREATPEDEARWAAQTEQKEREAAIKKAVMKAGAIELSTVGKLKPSAADCMWELNRERPGEALKVAQCIDTAKVFNDLVACISVCRK